MKKLYIALITISIVLILLASGLVIAYFAITNGVELDTSLLDKPNSAVILDARGNKIGGGSSYVSLADISPRVTDAFIAVEDARFYKHNGVDVYRMLGAAARNISKLKAAEGASTITQQLIKNTHLSNEKSLSRKIKEIKLAKDLEKSLSKNEILEKYLNVIYFGNGFYGIGEAAQGYFAKMPSELTAPEAAMLAGIVKSPNNYNPLASSDAAERRMKTVLKAMRNNGFIDENLYNTANNYKYKPNYGYNQNNYSQSYAKIAKYQASVILKGMDKDVNDELIIETYMSDELQRNCYSRLVSSLNYIGGAGGTICAADNERAALRAYASTEIYPYTRQVGSIMKPFSVYAPALELNYAAAATQILDEYADFNGYKPRNYGGATHGYVSMRESVMHSYNIPAVSLLNDIGISSVTPFLSAMNLNIADKDKNLSLALGSNSETPIDMLGCYAALANSGNFSPITTVKRIRTKDNKIIYNHFGAPKRVYRDDTAFIMTDMLRSTARSGTAAKLKYLNIDIAAKTGTVGGDSGNTDAYAAAYTTEHTFLAWFGSKDKPLDKSVTGGAHPTIALKSVIENMRGYAPRPFAVPSSVVKAPINAAKLKDTREIVYDANGIDEYFSRFNAPKAPEESRDNRRGSIFDKIRIMFGR